MNTGGCNLTVLALMGIKQQKQNSCKKPEDH